NSRLRRTLTERYGFGNLIGKSPAMQQVFDLIRQVAPRRSTVLVQGESGTGKELVAKAIHASSGRAEAPFVAINCGNIPSGLLEAASGGTLFLDEVATISLEMQAKLLRVIQEREFRRLGSSENVRVDVRIVAATNTDLEAGVREGTFRDDLYYRLNVIAIHV